MDRTVSGYPFLGIYELEKATGFAKVLGKGCGSVEGSTHVAANLPQMARANKSIYLVLLIFILFIFCNITKKSIITNN
jgi:hypothetical protein